MASLCNSSQLPTFWLSWDRRKAIACWSASPPKRENLVEQRRDKLLHKNCDMVVANLVDAKTPASTLDDNEVVLIFRDGEPIPLPRMSKRVLADRIFDQVLNLRRAAHATK